MTVRHGYAIGIDLGTSNTVAVVRWPDGRTRSLLFDGQPVLPSAVCLDETGQLHVGRDAQRLAQIDPARYEPNPKRRIDEHTVLLGDREGPIVGLLAAILQLIAGKATETCGLLPPAVVTYPASWGAARRQILQEAAARAGWPHARLLPEPIAAARYFTDTLRHPIPEGACLAVFDFGGGTLDIAVVRHQGGGFQVIGSGGAEDLGGLDFDAALVDHLGGLLAAQRPEVWRQLSAPATPVDRRRRRLFWEDIRGAKEMLSRATVAPVPIPGVDQALHLTRDEFQQLARPLLARAVDQTAAVVDGCRLAPGQLMGIFLVGGASRIPMAAQLLHTRFGFAPTVLDQPELPVAEGSLAEWAAMEEPVPESRTFQGPPAYAGAGAPGLPPRVPGPGFPSGSGGVPPRRRRRWLRMATTVCAVLVVGAALLVALDKGEKPFDKVRNVTTVEFQEGDESLSADVQDGWAYLPVATENGALRITAVSLDDPEDTWGKKLEPSDGGDGAASAGSWEEFAAHERLLTVYSVNSDLDRTLHVLDPQNGKELYREPVEDGVWHAFYQDTLIQVDPNNGKLTWIDVAGGKQIGGAEHTDEFHRVKNWTAEFQSAVAFQGHRFENPVPDNRVVTISSAGTIRVLDAANGSEVASGTLRDDVVESQALAYAGRLFVAGQTSETEGYQIYAYDLAKMGQPTRVFQDKTEDRVAERLEPCGERLLCVVDSDKHLQVVDFKDNAGLWRTRLAEPEDVGAIKAMAESIMVNYTRKEKTYAVFYDDTGEAKRFEGIATPVDGYTALLFDSDVASISGGEATPVDSVVSLHLSGLGAESGERSEIGSVDANPATCSWNSTHIACAAETEFRIHSFRD